MIYSGKEKKMSDVNNPTNLSISQLVFINFWMYLGQLTIAIKRQNTALSTADLSLNNIYTF